MYQLRWCSECRLGLSDYVSNVCCIHVIGQVLKQATNFRARKYSESLFHYVSVFHTCLLVGEHKQNCVSQLVLNRNLMQIVSCLGDAVVITIIAVHDEGQGLSIRVVVAPQRPNLVLSPDPPHPTP